MLTRPVRLICSRVGFRASAQRGHAAARRRRRGEIGADAAHDTRPVIFKFFTNLNPLALSGRVLQAQRSLPQGAPPGGADAPSPSTRAGGQPGRARDGAKATGAAHP